MIVTTIRKIRKVSKSKPTLEGAGVHLKRVFGHGEVSQFDPLNHRIDIRKARIVQAESCLYVLSGTDQADHQSGKKRPVPASISDSRKTPLSGFAWTLFQARDQLPGHDTVNSPVRCLTEAEQSPCLLQNRLPPLQRAVLVLYLPLFLQDSL